MIAVNGARPTRALTIPRTRAVGLCLAADQAPQGTVQVSGAQTVANGR